MSVLLAEDDSDIREVLAEVLRGEGFDVLEAANGLDALRLATARMPDVIVTDLMMPVMDGRELIEALRARTLLSHVPVIMITAYHARAQGIVVDRMLAKPFDLDEFTAAVRDLTSGHSEARL